MAQLKFGSAGVSSKEIDLSGPVKQEPTGTPAGVIGTANKGVAFVPVTVGTSSDYDAKFGKTDGKKFGPLAVSEWMRNASAVTYLRVLGAGDCRQRNVDGSVTSAGFVVGSKLPRASDGELDVNPYANVSGIEGRTYFLGAFMSESAGSTVFSSAGLQGANSVTPGLTSSLPIIRGVVMAPSGVVLSLSSSTSGTNTAPASDLVGLPANAHGNVIGSTVLLSNGVAKQEFVIFLNGHKGTDPLYPNVITASFDMTSPNYFGNVLNKDPQNIQKAGHCLYASWDIHPSTAVVTGTVLVNPDYGAGSATHLAGVGIEPSAFLTTSSLSRASGSTTVPDYESFADRFTHAKSPWVISQKFGGKPVNLFRFHAIDSGANISTLFKISVENIVPSTDAANKYGSFDIIVRSWNDRDSAQQPLEQFRGCTLDPSDSHYIAKVIGDANVYFEFDRVETAQKVVVDGNYSSNSNLIRVEMDDGIESGNTDSAALPMGFRGVDHLVTSGSAPLTSVDGVTTLATALKRSITPPVPMRQNLTVGSNPKVQINPLLYWGVQFEHVTSLTTPNASNLKNDSLKAFAKYFPNYSTINAPFAVGDNTEAADTAEHGVIDADRFCHNMFTLENVQVVTGTTTLADSEQWASATYVRTGNIVANDTNKTRAFTVDDLVQSNRRFAKFSMIMQGGFDGVNIFDKDSSEINDIAVTADMNSTARGLNNGPAVRSFVKAIEIMKNTVNTDIQLLAIPGIRNPVITDTAADAVQERFDALSIMDIQQYDNVGDEVVASSQNPSVALTTQVMRDRAIDNNFAAAYFPDVVMKDPTIGTNVVVPPSVVVLGALALNDAIGHPWFAPAGTTRGALPTVLEARVQLSKDNMDTLYDANINPLVAFPSNNQPGGLNPKGGVVVWGQKTLQASASALDRVNVRRLLINIRRQCRDIAQTIIFEPNREATLAKFSNAITPRLTRIQAQSGIDRFKVVIDSSTTTEQDVLNNTIRGKIFVRPTKTVEYVSLDFVVSNNIQQP